MHGEKIRYRVDPRDVPPAKVARRLHLTLAEFEAKKVEMFARGFPAPDPTTGMYDLRAIDAWMDARSSLVHRQALTNTRPLLDSREVFGDRARKLLDGHR
jgi:hypothetical protein